MKRAITSKAMEIGFNKIGFAPVATMKEAGNISFEMAEKGYFADCNYLKKNISLRVNPQLLVKNASTVIAVAVNYYVPVNYENDKLHVAHFAVGRDYHVVVKAMMQRLAEFIRTEFGGTVFISLDGGKVFEKLWAERCGIGWQGRNSLIITREYGSFVFLGIFITDLKILSFDHKAENACGNCRKCIEACPTEAIVKDKMIDIRRCTAYRTIEAKADVKSSIPGYCGSLCGCDICQNACPYNLHAVATHIKEFYPRYPENVSVSSEFIRNAGEEELLSVYGGTSVERALRNRKFIGVSGI